MALDPVLEARYRRLFRFYDRDGDGVHSLEGDFEPVAHALADRWAGRPAPFPDLLHRLIHTYAHENQRRDVSGTGKVPVESFVASHEKVFEAFQAKPEEAQDFIHRSAGGFFDVLDLDGDGVLGVDDLQALAAAYGHPIEDVASNLARMLAEMQLPPDRLPRAVFLELVAQFWFDPSPTAPGRLLFG
jgi:hypothetical protein